MHNVQHTTSLPLSFSLSAFSLSFFSANFVRNSIKTRCVLPLTQVKSQFQLCEMRRKRALLFSGLWWSRWRRGWWLCFQALNFTISIHITFYETHPIFYFIFLVGWDDDEEYEDVCCFTGCACVVWWTSFLSCSSPLEWMMMVETGSPTVSSWNTLLHPDALLSALLLERMENSGMEWMVGYVCIPPKWIKGDKMEYMEYRCDNGTNNVLLLNQLTNSLLHNIYTQLGVVVTAFFFLQWCGGLLFTCSQSCQ